jgi:hypothetical protein
MGLGIDDFYALLQELLTEEQLEKEWEHSLSEVAYQYDPASKTNSLVPLRRPSWMLRVVLSKASKEVPSELMPKGLILSLSNNALKSSDS